MASCPFNQIHQISSNACPMAFSTIYCIKTLYKIAMKNISECIPPNPSGARPPKLLDQLQRVTFKETRAHLGIETQRQWSDLAIARTTPCLFGLYFIAPCWHSICLQPDRCSGAAPPGMQNRRPHFPTPSHRCADAYGVTNIFQPRSTTPT